MARFPYDIEHEIGENNVQLLGMDVHNPVFFSSAILITFFVVGTLLAPIGAGGVLEAARGLDAGAR